MTTLLTIVVSLIASVVVFVGGMNLPASTFSLKSLTEPFFGAFTEISTATNLADFPTTYNANLTRTIEVGTTSVASIATLDGLTSASSLATIGTITTGVWNGTAITTAKGGTGSTTLSSNQILLGNGTGNINVVSGWGSSGQFLTSNGGTSAPTWQTGAIDQTADFNFTGSAFRVKNLHASSTVANPIVLNGVSYSMPSANSLGVLRNDGTGALTWGAPVRYTMASTTNMSIEASGATGVTYATSTILGIPANTLTASSTIKVSGSFDCVDSGGSGGNCSVFFRLNNGVEFGGMSAVSSPGTGITQKVVFNFDTYQNNSVSSQATLARAVQFQSGQSTGSLISHNDSSSSVDFSSAQSLVVVFKAVSLSGGTTLTLQIDNFVVEVNP